MDKKTLITLEYPKILERLASYAAFSASAELAHNLHPTSDLENARGAQKVTSEARFLLSLYSDFSIGGARDIRHLATQASRGGILTPSELQEVRNTLASGRELARVLERRINQFPNLAEIGIRLSPPAGIIDAISKVVSDQAKVLDKATSKLASIRKEIKIAHERIMTRLERYLSDSKTASMMQEAIITHRHGRYVIPLQAAFKGRIHGIIHDQSSSGATLFIEPMPVVELNNHWHELQLDERDEVRRILAELSALIGENSKHIHEMVNGIAELDLALMKAKYAEDLDAAEPLLEPFREGLADHPGCTIRLYQARHPLLDPEKVVSLDILLDDQTYSLVITGPNTGGKTVTIKTVGLLALMAQSGLHIPTLSGSTLSVFKDIYADIGDEQSIEQSLSTFSGHINNIIHILKQADETTLVLLDELGAGTDPQDGAALAQGILSYLMFWRIPNMVATHYPALKYFAHLTPGTLNASMEFDLETLQPTYHLIIGLPGKSNALLIAERLGLPDEIIQKARSTQSPDELRSDDLLEEILQQREIAKKERQEAEEVRQEADKTHLKLLTRLENIEDERALILQQARTEAAEDIEELQSELVSVRRTLKKRGQQVDELKVLQRQMEDLQKTYQEPVRRRRVKGKTPSTQLMVGDRVRLQSIGMDGEISSVGDEEAEIQAGALRVRAKISDIQLISKSGKPKPDPGSRRPRAMHNGSISIIHPSPGMELDLRGQRAEDALDNLASYLEDAYLAGLPLVRIIHGKGTGRLRSAVRKALGQSQRVKSWEKGLDGEGGEGVTVAHISADG